MAKIISYNVNGIRAALTKGLADWVTAQNADFVCLQEIKATPDQVLKESNHLFATSDAATEGGQKARGVFGNFYETWFPAQKKGYSGVATFSRREPTNVIKGCGISTYDDEGRILRTDFDDLTLLNCYFPSGTSGDERQSVKMQFLEYFFTWINELKKERPKLIIVGDYNIAHTPQDIHDPIGNKNSTGFLPEEREWLTKWFESGFTDAFRHLNPNLTEYSWWSYRAGARAKNKGWRIDYQSFSEALTPTLRAARHDNRAIHSDHCPIWVEADC